MTIVTPGPRCVAGSCGHVTSESRDDYLNFLRKYGILLRFAFAPLGSHAWIPRTESGVWAAYVALKWQWYPHDSQLIVETENPRRSGVFSSLRNLRKFFLLIHKYACWVIWKVETTRRVVSVKSLAPVLCGQFVCGWHKALCSIFILAGNESAAELIFFDLKSINRVTSDTWIRLQNPTS